MFYLVHRVMTNLPINLERRRMPFYISWLAGAILYIFTPAVFAAALLQYHHVDDKTPPSTSISPELFETHLEYIEENGFEVWSLPDVVEHLRASKPLPDKVVSITFDDAYRSIYDTAYPMLRARQWPFTIFVATEPVEQKLKSFISWTELKEMSENGATIANHTHSHAHLVRQLAQETEAAWLKRVREEITRPERLIKQHLEKAEKLFAYPYGEYTSEVQTLLQELGYYAFGQQSGAAGLDMNMTALPRFPMTNIFGSMKQFETKVASLPMAARKLEPELKIVTGNELADGLSIQFTKTYSGISCFFEGQPLEIKQSNDSILIEKMPDLPVGRSRINCTAPSAEQGRFYWFSHAWIKPKPDGSWYAEH